MRTYAGARVDSRETIRASLFGVEKQDKIIHTLGACRGLFAVQTKIFPD
nr:MAG TPA: hypothetical protein [Caudoviricetes sp.]